MLRCLLRRFRSAITGRYVTKSYAEAHPATTVRESASRRCRTPDGVCANPARCGRYGKCCWEQNEAL